MKVESAAVRVPASTSNLGSGFDTLGLAVRLYNHLLIRRSPESGIQAQGVMEDRDRAWFDRVLEEAGALFFRRAKQKPFGVQVKLSGEVPIARGLGASATIRVGVLAGLNALAGNRVPRQVLLDLATELEGHPDNSTPAIFGGFTVSGRVGASVRCHRFPISPKLKLVTLIPSFGISTEEARKLMPRTYSKQDAVHAVNRSALITAAFSVGRFEALRGVFDDRMHQPFREKLLPQLSGVIRAGERAGALGGFLSGSGSSIICLALDRAEPVGRAMRRVLPDSDVRILMADNEGFRVSTGGGR
jgi:homoserine kinase